MNPAGAAFATCKGAAHRTARLLDLHRFAQPKDVLPECFVLAVLLVWRKWVLRHALSHFGHFMPEMGLRSQESDRSDN
jgi:hypothetical protein